MILEKSHIISMDLLETMGTRQKFAIWTSDFVPESFEDIIGNTDIVQSVQKYFQTGNLPNIIMTGGNGTCKSTLARLIARLHLGSEKYKRGCLRIDGSIHRGKDVITINMEKKSTTEKNHYYGMSVIAFCKTYVSLKPGQKKIIIIYNFEHMTTEAQNALRRIMEIYSKKNRFILVCNNLSTIIEPIQSRCVCLRTKELDDTEANTLMKSILAKKQIELSQNILDTICLLSNGDMKKTINYLQMIANVSNPTLEKFYRIFNVPPIHVMKEIIECCQDRKTHILAYKKMRELLENGHNYCDILEILMNTLARFADLDKRLQIDYLKILTHCYHTAEKTSSTIYIYNLIAEFCLVKN